MSLQLKPTSVRIKTWGSFPLKVLGSCNCTVGYGDKLVSAVFYVVDSDSMPLLSYDLSKALGIMKELASVTASDQLSEILRLHDPVFTQEGKLLNCCHEIKIDQDAVPFAPPTRRVPPALLEKVKEELDRMVAADIIEPVSGPTAWCAPSVIAFKKDKKSLRVCADLRQLNKYVQRETYQMPTFEEIRSKVSGSTVFSILDCTNSYWQVLIAVNSQSLLNFSTPFGTFRYKRLCFGLNSAPEVFQKILANLLRDIPGCVNYMDDILLFAKDSREHDKILSRVLQVLKEAGIRLNKTKCEFKKSSVTFLGHVWSAEGVAPDAGKMKAISEMNPPESAEQMRSFLGFASYVGSQAVPHYSTLAKPLWDMLNDGAFEWSPEKLKAFEVLKDCLVNIQTRAFFDPQAEIVIQCDASPYGLGCVLLQRGKPILFASRTTTKAERNYSQLEREFLSVVFALHRFRLYLIGTVCTVQTDHRPILGIIGKSIDLLSARLRRWVIAIQQFDFKIEHIAGKNNFLADVLSRNAVFDQPSDAEVIGESSLCSIQMLSPLSLEQIATDTSADDEMQAVVTAIQQNWSSPSQKKLTPYYQMRNELSIFNFKNQAIITKGDRTVIPRSLTSKLLRLCHENHIGMSKMKSVLRASVYWPGMDKDVEAFCRACNFCLMHATRGDRAPLKQVASQVEVPWSKIAIDLTGPSHALDGHTLLTVIDLHSRYPEAYIIPNGSVRHIIEKLCDVFSRWGLPQFVISDNAPVFCSAEFNEFLAHHMVQPLKASVYYPQSNSTVERLHFTIKNRLARIKSEFPRKSLQACLYQILFDIRSTPNEVTGQTPFFLLTGRVMRTRISVLQVRGHPNRVTVPPKDISKFYGSKKVTLKKYPVGTNVLVRRGVGNKFTQQGIITKVINPTTYRIKFPSGREATYNQFHLKANVHPVQDRSDGIAAYEYVANQQARQLQRPPSGPAPTSSSGERGTGRHPYDLRKFRSKPVYR